MSSKSSRSTEGFVDPLSGSFLGEAGRDSMSLVSEISTSLGPIIRNMHSSVVTAFDNKTTVVNPPSSTSARRSSSGDIAAIVGSQLSSDEGGASSEVPYLTGEALVMDLKDVVLHMTPERTVPVVLVMTNYRILLMLSPSHTVHLSKDNPSLFSWLSLPLTCVDRLEKEKKASSSTRTAPSSSSGSSSGGSGAVTFQIVCKDVRQYRLTVNSDEYEVDRALSTMAAFIFPNNLKLLFAFSHCITSDPTYVSPRQSFDPMVEFSRMGVLEPCMSGGSASGKAELQQSMWRVSSANSAFRVCNSYPKLIIVPRQMPDEDLFAVAAFRSGGRLPVMSWMDRTTGSSLWRSSQPKAGVSGACSQDERYLHLLSQSSGQRMWSSARRTHESVLHIVDCRPRAAAVVNKATGAGYESQASYPTSRLEFYSIPNIHTMRDSHKALMTAVLNTSVSSDLSFSRNVEDSQWLYYSRLLLKTAWDTANLLRRGNPVLVHCSHGWDRTAQICSLTQLLLDPFYRTFDGFQILVEKEWCSMGHPFQLRCAHGQDKASRQDDQCSPIFLQFLDCVWQLVQMFPHYFEINSRYLVAVADHIYSGRFGTFLFNSDQDREGYRSKEMCVDIWTYLHFNRHLLSNPLYMDPMVEGTPTTTILLPPVHQLMRGVKLWSDYFLRWCGFPSLLSAPGSLSSHLFDSQGMTLASLSMSDVEKLHPHSSNGSYRGTSAAASSGSSRCLDLDVPAIVTGDDFWEAAFRCERSAKERLQLPLSVLDDRQHTPSMSRLKGFPVIDRSSGSVIRTPMEWLHILLADDEVEGEEGGVSSADKVEARWRLKAVLATQNKLSATLPPPPPPLSSAAVSAPPNSSSSSSSSYTSSSSSSSSSSSTYSSSSSSGRSEGSSSGQDDLRRNSYYPELGNQARGAVDGTAAAVAVGPPAFARQTTFSNTGDDFGDMDAFIL